MKRTSNTTNRTAPSKRVQDDNRGVSAVLGALLLFGLLMAVLVIIQATAVPIWNQGTEYQHNARIEGDIAETRDDILRSAAEGREYSSAIELGANYPTRPFLISPGDPSGTIRTTAPGTVTIRGAVASGEAGDYWNGSPVSYTTRSLGYEADYNELRNSPRYVIDNTALIKQYEETTLGVGSPTLVSDRRINLVLLNGSVSRSGTSVASLTVNPISAPATTTTVSADNQPITITVPTQMNAKYWETALAEERASNGGHILAISVEEGSGYNQLRIQLEKNVTYVLRTAKIGLGNNQASVSPHYLTAGTGPPTINIGKTQEYTFVVRDRYNNPVQGVDPNVSVVDGPGEIVSVSGPSGPDGVVTVQYRAATTGTASIQATFGSSPNALQTASHTVEVTGSSSAGATPAIDQGMNSNIVITNVSTSLLLDANEVTVTFNNQDGTTREVVSARFVAFYDGVVLCPCPGGVRIGSSSPPVFRNEPMTTIIPNVSLSPGDTTVELAFVAGDGTPASVDSQDWILLELVFDDGSQSTYLIQLDTEDAT